MLEPEAVHEILKSAVQMKGGGAPVDASDARSSEHDLAAQLLYELLQYDPSKRLTPEAALMHPYCNQFYIEPKQPRGELRPVHAALGDTFNDSRKEKTAMYREELYKNIRDNFQQKGDARPGAPHAASHRLRGAFS